MTKFMAVCLHSRDTCAQAEAVSEWQTALTKASYSIDAVEQQDAVPPSSDQTSHCIYIAQTGP